MTFFRETQCRPVAVVLLFLFVSHPAHSSELQNIFDQFDVEISAVDLVRSTHLKLPNYCDLKENSIEIGQGRISYSIEIDRKGLVRMMSAKRKLDMHAMTKRKFAKIVRRDRCTRNRVVEISYLYVSEFSRKTLNISNGRLETFIAKVKNAGDFDTTLRVDVFTGGPMVAECTKKPHLVAMHHYNLCAKSKLFCHEGAFRLPGSRF